MDYEERDGKFIITGGEPSWPEGFPISSCQLLMNDIGLSAFLAECQHETKPPEGDVFSHINFARCSWDDVPKLKKTVVWVDPAVTSTDSSDSMGIHCDGLGTDGKIYRLWSWENRANPYAAIRLAVTKAIELKADVVGVEVNQGRDLWRGVYDQVCEDIRKEGEDYYRRLPRYKESIATKDLGSKIARAQRMLVDYERGVFVHVEGTHTTLEMALRRFPKVKPYDLVDSSFWAWNEIAGGMHRKKSRVSSAKGRHTKSSI
jgi:phage terminase large subunit-like protein